MHKLLRAQISKILGEDIPLNPAFNNFIQAINNTYTANDLDINCMERITEISRQQNLQKSEKRYHDMIKHSQALICTHDMEGRILSVNPAVCQTTGYTEEELVGQLFSSFMPEEHKLKFKEEYLASFKTGNDAEGVMAFMNKNKETVYLLYKNFKTQEEEDTVPYINGFAQDITARIIAEKRVQIAQKAAEESIQVKELFLSNISHELCTPMNGIVGLTNLLLKTPLNDRQQLYAESVKQSAEGLLEIVNGILEFNNLETNKMKLKEVAFDICNVMYNISYTYNHEALRKGLQLITLVDDDLPEYLMGDPSRLNQVLVNLMSNAIKFTENGKITLKVERVTEQVSFIRLKISVIDTGTGIPKDKIETIFNSFTQVNADYTRKYGGTGLGLCIVSKLLGLMNSQINVESEMGVGTTFSFEIDYSLPSYLLPNRNKTIELSTDGKLKGMRILLAEDNKVNQLFAHELINDWGASLDIAANGKQAIEFVNKNTYDLILMDIQMPEMSGMQATEIIRNELPEPTRSIKIIALTANAMKCDDKKYLDGGMDDVLFKPYQPLELYNKIVKQLPWNLPVQNFDVDLQPTKKEKNTVTFISEFEYACLDTLISFSRGKNEFVTKMLNVLLTEIPMSIASMQQSIAEEQWDKVSYHAHKMIPNMNMTGNQELETVIKWIELNAEPEKDKALVLKNYKQINVLWDKVREELVQAHTYYLNSIIVKTE